MLENRGEHAMHFSKNILTTIKITRPPDVRSALKPSQMGFDMYRFGWCDREVQGEFVARDFAASRFLKCAPFSKKLLSPYVLLAFRTLSILMTRSGQNQLENLACRDGDSSPLEE